MQLKECLAKIKKIQVLKVGAFVTEMKIMMKEKVQEKEVPKIKQEPLFLEENKNLNKHIANLKEIFYEEPMDEEAGILKDFLKKITQAMERVDESDGSDDEEDEEEDEENVEDPKSYIRRKFRTFFSNHLYDLYENLLLEGKTEKECIPFFIQKKKKKHRGGEKQ